MLNVSINKCPSFIPPTRDNPPVAVASVPNDRHWRNLDLVLNTLLTVSCADKCFLIKILILLLRFQITVTQQHGAKPLSKERVSTGLTDGRSPGVGHQRRSLANNQVKRQKHISDRPCFCHWACTSKSIQTVNIANAYARPMCDALHVYR